MPLFKKSPKQPPAPSTPTSSSAPSSDGKGASGGGELRIRQIGHEFLDHARKHKSGFLSKQFWSDKLMDWSMKDHDFKVQLFRFVDTFPVLRHSSEAVHDHLADYLSQPGVKLPPGLDLGLRAGGIAKSAMTKTISSQIESMAHKFIAGIDANSALHGLKDLWKDGIAFSVDLLGEACVSDDEADAYRDKYLDLVTNLPDAVAAWPANPRLEADHLGPIPRTNVSIKITSLSAKADPIDTPGAIRDLMTRLVPILERARDKGVFINFDMEQFRFKDMTIELFEKCCEQLDLGRMREGQVGGVGGVGGVGIALQAYLKSGDADAKRIADRAKTSGRIVTVRLVKGAYWDYETIHAEQMGWPCPVWNTKPETDACFERMTNILLDATPRKPGDQGGAGVRLALGSHNARSIAAALAGLEQRALPKSAIEIQMLHGMADQLKAAAAELDLRIREYVPVGEMIPGMAYLVRRLLENTSNESWLKAGFLDNADEDTLLADPAKANGHASRAPGASRGTSSPASTKQDLYKLAPERHNLSPAIPGLADSRPFFNEPLRDFADASQRSAFAAAIERATIPTAPDLLTEDQARAALEAAHTAFPRWRDTPIRERAACLVKAAAILRARRDELSGVMIKEAGKTWREADADICEAIDFCEYYARVAVPMFERHRLGRFIGELDETWYQPKGVAVVIAPWNFPSAIFTGMATAALVTGNTALVKPARQTVGIAKLCVEALWEAGVPRDVLHFAHSRGSTVGAVLVRDPRVSLIAFTGSKEVGLDIIKGAAEVHEGQLNVKKIISEMGGKNAIIIDTSADLDEAVLGVRYSAFGYQGQKCSACSRVIVVDPDGPDGAGTRHFIDRLVASTNSLVIDDPMRPGADVGPVIDEAAAKTIRAYIEKAKAEGCTLELAMKLPDHLSDGAPGASRGTSSPSPVVSHAYVPPHIFSHVTMNHTIGREEIFGPVLAIMHARTFDEALDIANASEYKLTGAVYTRKPAHIEQAKRTFRVGNLYINRGSTGALVARQPFGGFAMSGVGTKAGGADYLHHFTDPRASCENTMRRGFAPEL